MLPNNMSRLTLAGTVALPSPFSTCGILCVEEIDGKKVVSITYDSDDEYTIIRKVFATDVSAIYLDKTEQRGAQWFYTRGSVEPIDSRFGGILPVCSPCGDADSPVGVVKGIVFVPEDAPVLNQVASTAA